MSPSRRDGGFTLIEMMVVVGLVSLLAALGAGAWKQWTVAHAQLGAATDMQTVLRQTQMRAVTEGVGYCVRFDTAANTYTVFRTSCDTPPAASDKVSGPFTLGDPRVKLTNVSFSNVAPAASTELTFRASGTASPGGLQITRTGSTKVYTLDVEGLTGRVSVS